MFKDTLFKKYMELNKLLLSVINIDNKTVDVFDGDAKQTFSYREFCEFEAKYFNIIPDFFDKTIVLFETIDSNNEELEVDAEYKRTTGEPVSFLYNIVKQSDKEYLLFIKENEKKDYGYLDQMTKANPKSYIDNRAKNNMLTKTPFVLLMIDIDAFKHINDTHGQLIGDMILIEMVTIARNILGDRGAISRIGGDRFLIIYDIEDNYDIVHDFIFDIKQQMQRLSICASRGISITLTIGSAQYPSDGPYELLLKKCLKALIRGKNKGRDCFVMYLEHKCGKVTLDDVIEDKINKIDRASAKNDVYSFITSVNQQLADDKNFDDSIDRAISLIGNYFYVDRISIARLDIKTGKIMKHHSWYNPKISVEYPAYCTDEIIPDWAAALGQKNYVMIDDHTKLEDTNPLAKLFLVDHTTASMAFELIVNKISFGLIRFDMTTGIRHWQSEDFQVFMLISQLVASHIQKNYLKETNYKTLFLEPKYGCFNFTKMFSDTGDLIIQGRVSKFTILEVDIKDIIKFRSFIGMSKMAELVKVITSALDTFDCIYGKQSGGAFVIFFNHQNKEIIEDTVKKIQADVKEYTDINHIHELLVQTGAYLGDSKNISLIDAISNAHLTRVLNEEIELLYYSDDIKNKSLFQNEMLLRLDEALDNDEFLLYLQPKIGTKDGTLVGAEALTRWHYKHEKLLFPDQFILFFEENDVIDKLDYKVFMNVCDFIRNLINKNIKPFPISVNVSRFITNFDVYLDNLERIRKKYDIDPQYIEIEITEGMYYENSYIISSFIDKLHKIGYLVAMDDFGAGYSNLVSLAKLNFDVIKFDRSFCIDLENSNVRIMLDKLMDLVRSLKKKTICEGVETEFDVKYLTKIGCDSIQGFYYSKPIPWYDFMKKYFE